MGLLVWRNWNLELNDFSNKKIDLSYNCSNERYISRWWKCTDVFSLSPLFPFFFQPCLIRIALFFKIGKYFLYYTSAEDKITNPTQLPNSSLFLHLPHSGDNIVKRINRPIFTQTKPRPLLHWFTLFTSRGWQWKKKDTGWQHMEEDLEPMSCYSEPENTLKDKLTKNKVTEVRQSSCKATSWNSTWSSEKKSYLYIFFLKTTCHFR